MANINFFKLKYFHTAIRVVTLGLIGSTFSIFAGGDFSIQYGLSTMIILISAISVFQMEYYSDWIEAIVEAIFLALAPLGILSLIELLIYGKILIPAIQVTFLLYQFSLWMVVVSWIAISVLVAVRKESRAKLQKTIEEARKHLCKN